MSLVTTTQCPNTTHVNGRRCAEPKGHDGLHDFMGVAHMPTPTCPNCDGPLVFDSGLYHCDAPAGSGCGAWDPEDIR